MSCCTFPGGAPASMDSFPVDLLGVLFASYLLRQHLTGARITEARGCLRISASEPSLIDHELL